MFRVQCSASAGSMSWRRDENTRCAQVIQYLGNTVAASTAKSHHQLLLQFARLTVMPFECIVLEELGRGDETIIT